MFNAKNKKIYPVISFAVALTMVLAGCSSAKNASGEIGSSKEPVNTSATVPVDGPEVFGIKLNDMDAGGTLKGQYKDKKIIIATMAGDTEKALKDAAGYFQKVSGATVEVQSFPAESYMEK